MRFLTIYTGDERSTRKSETGDGEVEIRQLYQDSDFAPAP
jgi:hypothetical protein